MLRATDFRVDEPMENGEGSPLHRPRTWKDCFPYRDGCPWVGCRHHLFLDVRSQTGVIQFNFPDQEPTELRETCALWVATRGGVTLEDVGNLLNLTRERVRQIETAAVRKLKVFRKRLSTA